MKKERLSLQPSEGLVFRAAANIYSAYITSGHVVAGKEEEWLARSLKEAMRLAFITDEAIQSDTELN